MKPTKELIKEFWGRCGFRYEETTKQVCGVVSKCFLWRYPDGSWHEYLPPVDFNNLFLYADQILDKLGEHYIILQKQWNDYSIKQASIAFVNIAKFPDEFRGEGNTYADALFLAIYSALGKTP